MYFKPKISHEFVENILGGGSEKVDYDYALVHLLKKNDYYRNFFYKQKEKGREIILDNSLFEMGEAFSGEEYATEIQKLEPTYYVLPDVFNAYQENLDSARRFLDEHFIKNSFPVGAIHGESLWELTNSYVKMLSLLKPYKNKKIAIPFGSRAFEFSYKEAKKGLSTFEIKKYENDYLYKKSRNRFYFLEKMAEMRIINREVKHHLLGNYTPAEFVYYRESLEEFTFIDSIDTSHPVAMGLEGATYSEAGIYYKSAVKVDLLFKTDLDLTARDVIFNNVDAFRDICLGRNK